MRQKSVEMDYKKLSQILVGCDAIMYERDFARWFYRNTGKHLDEFDVASCMYRLERIDEEPFDIDDEISIEEFKITLLEPSDESSYRTKLDFVKSQLSAFRDSIDRMNDQTFELFDKIDKIDEFIEKEMANGI